jgi:hypothetical protein
MWKTTIAALLVATLDSGVLAQARHDCPALSGPAVGTAIPELQGYDLQGLAVTVNYGSVGKPTVLYTSMPSHFVLMNEANFAALVRQASSKFRFVVIAHNPSASPLLDFPAYVKRIRPTWGTASVEVVRDISLSREQVTALGLGGHPQTLVVSEQGRLVRAFSGAFLPNNCAARPADVEAFFAVKLPGPVSAASR